MTKPERAWVERIKAMDCIVCGHHGPSEAHEIEQGLWFLSIPLCADCHRGGFNGLHGQARIWSTLKLTEIRALHLTLQKIMSDTEK